MAWVAGAGEARAGAAASLRMLQHLLADDIARPVHKRHRGDGERRYLTQQAIPIKRGGNACSRG